MTSFWTASVLLTVGERIGLWSSGSLSSVSTARSPAFSGGKFDELLSMFEDNIQRRGLRRSELYRATSNGRQHGAIVLWEIGKHLHTHTIMIFVSLRN